jgi:Na+-driven multidrug efflux pump
MLWLFFWFIVIFIIAANLFPNEIINWLYKEPKQTILAPLPNWGKQSMKDKLKKTGGFYG